MAPMAPRNSVKEICRSNKGQSLIELTVITPLMLLMVYGVVEIGSVISTYLTLTHTTREGANLTSRGTDPNDALSVIIAAASPTIRNDNDEQWQIIYTRIGPAPGVPCPQAPCQYVIEDQIYEGSLGQVSKLVGGIGATVNGILSLDNVAPNQKFHVVEAFYDYEPQIISFVGNTFDKIFYDRTVFTNVSGAL